MRIFIGDEFIGDWSINFECIDKSDILNEDSIIMIPFHDVTFLSYAKTLINNLVVKTDPNWKFPDYHNFKSYIYIEDSEYRISLEVYPEIINSGKRNEFLQKASKQIREDGYSDYYEIQDAFDAADAFFAGKDLFGEVWSYRALPTDEEIKLLSTV